MDALQPQPPGAPRVEVRVNPRARRASLRVDAAARRIIAVAPSRRAVADLDRLIAQHAAWIAKQLASLPPARPFIEGASLPLRGRDHLLARVDGRGPAAVDVGPPARLCVPAPQDRFAARVRRALLAEALSDAQAAVAQFSATLGVAARRVRVRDTKSRWGSCTAAGDITLNWRLICAPPRVLAYVAAHETAHLLERNHSSRFWATVERAFGDPADERSWLRAHASALFAVGADAAP